jgi:hypothetical protein
MLQYPIVEPEIGSGGKPTGIYLVNAGEGRRLAQLLRAKKKADEPIPSTCVYRHPTVDGYFGRVPKERLLEAVREGVSADAAKRITTMKKGAMAEAAAEMPAGKNWLPPLLRNAP